MERKKTILIFGISSFLGSNLANILSSKYRVVGTYMDTPVHMKGILTIKCDVHNKNLVQNLVYLFKPEFTIYAVGLSNLNDCQDFPKVADALNTVGIFNVTAATERYGSKFIYFSSSYIFSGEDTLYREQDTPMPTSVYGNTVASSEFYIQKSCLNYLIFRCCPLFGRTYNPHDLNWMEVIERSLFQGKTLICDTNVKTGFLDVWTVAKLLDWALTTNVTNRLLQVSSSDIMTRHDFAKLYLEIFGGTDSILGKGDWKFPRTENQVSLQGLGEELHFRMDVSNIEMDFGDMLPTVKKSIQSVYTRLNKNQKKSGGGQKSSEIVFI